MPYLIVLSMILSIYMSWKQIQEIKKKKEEKEEGGKIIEMNPN